MKDYCELEECLALKELGFKERVLHYFENVTVGSISKNEFGWDFNSSFLEFCSRPSYEEAFEFFEKEFDLYIEVVVDRTLEPKFCYSIYLYRESHGWDVLNFISDLFYTRAEAKKECLKELIKIAKNER